MPTNLTGNPASFPTQTAPIGGDPRTASSVATPLQNAADRTEYCKDRILYVDPDKTGIRKFRSVTGSAGTVRAITDHTNGDYILWANFGVWLRYDSASASADDGVLALKPDDVAGSGRWVCDFLTGGNFANRHVVLDTSTKVPSSLIHNGAQSAPQTLYNLTHSTTSTSFVTIGSDLTVSSPAIGYLEMAYDITADPPSGSLSIYRIQFVDPLAVTGQSADIEIPDPTGTTVQRGGMFIHPSNPAGTWTVRLQVKSGNGATASTPRAVLRAVAR